MRGWERKTPSDLEQFGEISLSNRVSEQENSYEKQQKGVAAFLQRLPFSMFQFPNGKGKEQDLALVICNIPLPVGFVKINFAKLLSFSGRSRLLHFFAIHWDAALCRLFSVLDIRSEQIDRKKAGFDTKFAPNSAYIKPATPCAPSD